MKQTAVEWLEEIYLQTNNIDNFDLEVAKEMEKQQVYSEEEVFNDDKKENIKKFIDEIKNPSEPNQALKDAFEKYSEYLENFENKNTYEHGFKDGAKWQQENSYSLDDLKEAFSMGRVGKTIKDFNEQFKNK
jgi:uncharacterized protein (DUF1778 family)